MNLLDSVFGFPRVHAHRTYTWDCIMPDLWGFGVLGLAVSKFCQSVKIGNYDMSDISEMKTSSLKKFFAGGLDIKTMTATFIAPVPDVVSNYFHTWKKKIVDDEGFYHKASDYKRNIYIVLYDRSGIPANMITAVGAFPKTFPAWNLDYKSEALVTYDIEFRVDSLKTGLGAFASFGGDALKALGDTAGSIGKIF